MSPNDSCYYMKASSSLNQWHRGTCLSGGFWSSSRCVRGLSENWGRMRSDKLCSVYRYRYRCSMGILYCCGYSMDIDWHIYIYMYIYIYICTNTYKYQINTQMHGICTEVLPGNLPIITFGFVSVCWMCFSMFFHVFPCFSMFFHVFKQKNMLKCWGFPQDPKLGSLKPGKYGKVWPHWKRPTQCPEHHRDPLLRNSSQCQGKIWDMGKATATW